MDVVEPGETLGWVWWVVIIRFRFGEWSAGIVDRRFAVNLCIAWAGRTEQRHEWHMVGMVHSMDIRKNTYGNIDRSK